MRGCIVRCEVQSPTNLAINMHGVVHVFARSLTAIKLLHEWPQGGVQQLQPPVSRDGDLREIPIELGGIPKPMPSRFAGVRLRRGEDVSAINGDRGHRALQLCASDVASERQRQDNHQRNQPPRMPDHAGFVTWRAPVMTLGANPSHLSIRYKGDASDGREFTVLSDIKTTCEREWALVRDARFPASLTMSAVSRHQNEQVSECVCAGICRFNIIKINDIAG